MRASWLAFWLMGVMLAAVSALSQQPMVSGVAGVVVDAKDGQPLARVHVHLARLSVPHLTYGTFTTPNGRFTFSPIEPGVYWVGLDRKGFVQIWQDKVSQEDLVEVKTGNQLDLKCSMEREAIFSGNVLDEYGEPMLNVGVTLRPAGLRYLSEGEWKTVWSNDRGEFQFTVRPGKYYLAASRRFMPGELHYQGETRTDGTEFSDYVETFYPSAKSKAAATIIEGKSGQEINGLEIHLARSGARTISGVVSGIPQGANVRIWAAPISNTTGNFADGTPVVFPDGRFSIEALDSGTYRVYAVAGSGDDNVYGQKEITLAGSNVEGVELPLGPGAEVTGAIIDPAAPHKGSSDSESTRYEVRLKGQRHPDPQSTTADADGKFELTHMAPDHYRVTIEPMEKNSCIESVEVNGSKSSDGVVSLAPGEKASIKIRISAKGGSISGKVIYPGLGLRWSVMWLAPKRDDLNSEDISTSFIEGAERTYSFQGLAPGTYWVGLSTWGFAPTLTNQATDLVHEAGSAVQVVTIKQGENVVRDFKPGQ